MSGFAALVERDGRRPEQGLLDAMADAMAYRGPDRRSTAIVDAGADAGRASAAGVGLVHAAFDTLAEPAEGPMPLDLERRLWISADARVDDRAGLVAALEGAGRSGLASAPDAALLLHAHDAWGTRMLGRLLGDFAFALWDASGRSLRCARDHFGVKPLYYAEAGTSLLVSNTIAALRTHPGVSDELDEHAIADYLLFGYNRHPTRTSFADVRRLPPAHTLSWDALSGELSVDRYWTLDVTDELRLGSDAAYVERFSALLEAAVADRVRGPRAAVLMSGGLDSTAVAGLARDEMRRRFDHAELAACTFAFDGSGADPEPEEAARVAADLGIPIHRVSLADDADGLWGDSAAWSAEPTDLPASARLVGAMRRSMPGTRVGLTGQGGDPTMHITPEDARHRAGTDGLLKTSAAMGRYAWDRGRLPRTGLRTALKRRLRGRRFETPPAFPPWIREDLSERLGLRDRHRELVDRELDPDALRPEAQHQLAGPEWSFLLEWYDAGMTGFAAELRHPFLDVRLVEFLLALPAVPWLVEKEILRRAMIERLPAATLSRRKTPVAGYPIHGTLLSSGDVVSGPGSRLGLASRDSRLAEFIDTQRFATIARRPERLRPWEYELITRPLGLALWLSRLGADAAPTTENPGEPGRHDAAQEAVHEA